MPTRDAAPIGDPCWIDLSTSDVPAARAFYRDVLGWVDGESDEQFGGYFMFSANGVPTGGAMENQSGGAQPDGWTIYVAVDNAESTLNKGAANGAMIIVPAMAVGDLGTMGVMIDPSGAAIGVWAPNQFPGFLRVDEVGAPTWFELHTNNYDAATKFYAATFDWDLQVMGDGDDFRYSTAQREGGVGAGIMDATSFLPAGVGSYWTVYVGVENADAASKLAVANGGAVIAEAEDTPYGRLATLADPTGATFRIMQN